jgi:hypothetical protein
MLKTLGWQTLPRRRYVANMSRTYMSIHGLIAIPLGEPYLKLSDSTYLRGHQWKLITPASRTNTLRHSFFHRVPFDWNALPAQVVNAPSLDSFISAVNSSAC